MLFSCLQTDANWYLGEDCKYQVHKVGFYTGMAVVAVVLIIAIAVLSTYVWLNKRKEKRYEVCVLNFLNVNDIQITFFAHVHPIMTTLLYTVAQE